MPEEKQTKGFLDRSQPHAQVYGDDQGRVWEQDGRFFYGDGSPWKPRKDDADVAVERKPAKG